MWVNLPNLVEKLKDQETFSSFLPLLSVVTVFSLISIFILVTVLRMMRAPKIAFLREEKGTERTDTLVLVNKRAKVRRFFRRLFVGERDFLKMHLALMEQIDALRKKLQQANTENIGLRGKCASDLNRLNSIEEEIRTLKAKELLDKRTIFTAHAMRTKFQQKAEHLQSQLTFLMEEMGRLTKQNVKSAELQDLAGQMNKMVQSFMTATDSISPPTTPIVSLPMDPRLLAEKDMEIERLKDLLLVCKSRLR